MENQNVLTRWSALVLGLILVWFVTFVAGPALTRSSAAITHLASVIDEGNIETGEFYYTDVEACIVANLNTRSTIEYPPHGGQ